MLMYDFNLEISLSVNENTSWAVMAWIGFEVSKLYNRVSVIMVATVM